MPFSKESLLERLSAARGAGRLAHAYLFTGPSGSGKFWLAIRLGALELGCRLENAPTHPDMHIVQPESKSRRIVTEQIRILSHSIYRKPLLGRSRVALIQDADRMQIQAANVFLKTLEEPPSGSLILLLSARPRAVLPTIRSRCLETALLGATPAQSEEQLSVLGALEECLSGDRVPGITEAFLFTRVFQGVLSRLRDRISSKYENALNKEIAHYKKASEDSSWFEERIAQTKALIEAEALRERDHMVETVLAALGEALRIQHGFSSEDLVAKAIATRIETRQLLRQLDSLESLRHRLALGVQESLALESGFLEMVKNSRADTGNSPSRPKSPGRTMVPRPFAPGAERLPS
jgi:DNA polymerase III, gamma/tau subunits